MNQATGKMAGDGGLRVRKPGFRSGQGDLAVAGTTTWLFAGVTTPVGLTRQVPFSAIPGSVEGVPRHTVL